MKVFSFHRFPADDKLSRQWIAKIRRDVGPEFTITSHTNKVRKNSGLHVVYHRPHHAASLRALLRFTGGAMLVLAATRLPTFPSVVQKKTHCGEGSFP